MSKVQITAFTGEYYFLSNYCTCPITIDGLTYRSAEAAFQAAKCNVPIGQPNVAKAIGRKIKLRKGWEKERDGIMAEVIHAKFSQNPALAQALIDTGDAELIEGNTWNDNYWGVCGCARCRSEGAKGLNKLGKILMAERARLHPPAAVCIDCRNMTANEELSATLQAKGNGGQSLNYINPVAEPLIYDARGNGDGITSPTMTGDHNSRVTDYTAITLQGDTVAGALLARDYKGPGRADSLGRVIAQPVGADLYNGTLTGDKAVTLTTATGQGGANTGPSVIEKIIRWIVRRLTPTECERLQGYPDGWTDLGDWVDSKGKAHKAADTPRYKALGNSIALPQWYYVLGGIADRLPEDATLGSLFDGIGGFPYVWAQLHAGRKQLCVWASEIEEFPIAVTKKWFPEVEDGKLF